MDKSKIIQGDSLEVLKTFEDNSIDAVITDPPYGYSFMGKDWDKAVPSVEIWKECLRVLKPGAWCMVMSAPRSDVQNAMISRLIEAGFRLDFTPIYWTYASGFPKAGNIGKLVDKRLGAERGRIKNPVGNLEPWRESEGRTDTNETIPDNIPLTDEAKALDGSYAGFQPKPAVEVIIVAMKPLSEKTYVDQALTNGKGITWLDDCRVPTIDKIEMGAREKSSGGLLNITDELKPPYQQNQSGRFPANLLVSDDVLNDGRIIKSGGDVSGNEPSRATNGVYGDYNGRVPYKSPNDSGSYSRYFDLDAWANNLPFLAVPKASKSEKNKGLESRESVTVNDGRDKSVDNAFQRGETQRKNSHPTVKPLKLMSYLITLTTRPGAIVLDPFVGSGTTALAAKNLDRIGIGIEREEEYVEIAKARLG